MEEHKPNKAHPDRTANESEAVDESQRKKQKVSDGDIRLSIGDTVIVADKFKLAESSPFFASLLRFHADANLDAVSLEPPDHVYMGSFLAMLYSLTNAEVNLKINATNVWDCIVLSKYFQLEHVEEECYSSLRKMLCTLTMDELLRLWRNGHACAMQQVTSLMVTGISLKMDGIGGSHSMEFLDMTVDELAALMSGDGFLPLVETDVCKAVMAWFEFDSSNRSKPPVAERIPAELVWDNSVEAIIRSLPWEYRMPETMPKRIINSIHEIQCQAGEDGIVVGKYLYNLKSQFTFQRTDTLTGEETALEVLEMRFIKSDEEGQFGLCLVKLADHERIGCFASYWVSTRVLYPDDGEYDETFDELENTIALYDIATDNWEYLPSLHFNRIDTVMIQCGSFLYVIGGTEQQHYWETEAKRCNAHHCYRLDLTKFSARDRQLQWRGEWERIADLNAPRIKHSARVQYGRIIVYEGRTKTGVDKKGNTRFEEARWVEAYDVTLNIWTVFQPSS